MNLLAAVALLAWLPFVVLVFNSMPPKKAVPGLFVAAWLFLPNGGFPLPGMPDYTKMTATVIGVLFSAVLFDQARLLSLRFRWIDLPILGWCGGSFVTAMVNGLGPYEGAAAVVTELVYWGLPYLIGRVYLDDVESLKDMARAMVVGAICYIPLCLIELRFSPMLQTWIYGIARWEGVRYGGYRPKVFLQHGLELGMWMTNTTLLGYALWSCGSVKQIRGYPFGVLMLGLLATAILCKSTGALALLAFALGIFWVTRRAGRSLAVWLMVAIAPIYCLTRTFDLWSGQEVVALARATVGEDRAKSFEYRLNMERLLTDRARERLLLGWGRFNRFQVSDANGKAVTVPDGYWVIALGVQGLVGLSCTLALFLLPMVLTLRRFPVSSWRDPQVGPVVALALMLVLEMIDFLSNAMISPLYPLVAGGILGQIPYRPSAGHEEAEEALSMASQLAGEGRFPEADREFRRAIELVSPVDDAEARRVQAEAFDGLGQTLLAGGRPREAVAALQEALVLRDALAAEFPDDDRFRDLAIAREGLGRALAELGRTAEAIEERQHALQIWEILANGHPRDAEYRDRRANSLNDLAWILATEPPVLDPARALALAEEAVRISPDHDASWNTLGVARYRAGDWAGAIEALERSALAGPDGAGTAFDHYFLAMAWWQLHREDQAGEWLERGMAWAARHRQGHPSLDRFREEAESLLRPELA